MLRAVLLGLLTLSAVSCKSHDESQAKSQPGIAAGKVIEVTGTVTLHHGTDTRPLAKGDMVDADDVVETGADGSAVIEVQHNSVNWEIGASKKGKMRESLAWTQPKKDKAAKAAEEDSAAAGRHAERSAADNSATAAERAREDVSEDKKKEEAPRAEAAMAPQAEAAAAPAPVAAPTPPPAPPVAQPVAPPKVTAPAKAATASAPKAAAAPAPGGASKNAVAPSTSSAPPPPPPPPKSISRSMAPPDTTADSGLGLTGTGEGGGGTGGGGGLEAAKSAAPASPDAAHLVFAKRPDLRKCVKSVKSLRIKIEIDDAGKATLIFVDKADAADQSCVKKVIDGIKFPPSKTTITSTLVKA